MTEKKSCSDCSLCEGKGEDAAESCPSRPLAGWRFSATAAISFLLPVVTAILGATLYGGSAVMELLGGTVGFLLGIGVAFVVIRWTTRRHREEQS